MPRPIIIEWPDKAKVCVIFIIPREVWPENFATRESLQRQGTHTIPPANAVYKKNMAAVTEREYGDRVGIWHIMDMFERHGLNVTFLMNGLKVEQFAAECKKIQNAGTRVFLGKLRARVFVHIHPRAGARVDSKNRRCF
jgi:hypothetical protein